MTVRRQFSPLPYARTWVAGSVLATGLLSPVASAIQSQPAATAADPTGELSAQYESDIDRLVRRLYLASGEDRRIETLTSLLSDQSTPVVRSALDLALREQTGGSRLDDRVTGAVLTLMAHPDPAIRSKAAALADLVASPEAGQAILDRLGAETDPAVAEVLLRAAARWPGQLDPAVVLRWNRADAAMRPGLARAVSELQRVRRVSADASSEILSSIALTRDADLTPSMCRLLAQIGGSREHARLSSLLSSQDSTVRRRAAAALAEIPGQGEMVIRAAMRDDSLVDAAVVATLRMPPRQALDTLLTLPEPKPDPASDRIRAVSAKLPVTTLVEVAKGPWSSSRRVDLLASARARKVDSPARGQALVMLAEALTERGDRARAAEAATLASPMLSEGTDWHSRAVRIASAPIEPGDP